MAKSPVGGPRWLEPGLEVLRQRYFGVEPGGARWTAADWSRATGAALVERLGPALGEAAATSGVDLPKPCWAALVAARLENERRSAAQRRALADLGPLLESRGIAPVLFKGLALARHYPDGNVREAADVDLLVAPEQLAALQEALREIGFQQWAGGGRDFSRYQLSYARDDAGEDTVALDLHPAWHEISLASDGGAVRVGERVEVIERAGIGGVRWGVLPSVFELYLTAAHSVLHGFRTASVYLDLAVLLGTADEATLRDVAGLARASGRDRHLRHALTTAADLFGIDVASEFWSLPRRLGVPLAWRMGYVGSGVRFLPSSLVMELLLRRGFRRKLGFARWVLGHGEREPASLAAKGRRLLRGVRGLHWFKGTVLRYRGRGAPLRS
jgi:hypothetical protein